MPKKPRPGKSVASIRHADKRKNIPTVEFQAVLKPEEQKPLEMRYARNRDLDPQLMWRGKDEQDWSELVVHAPPLYIQEKVQPKVLIEDLLRRTQEGKAPLSGQQSDLFADFNGIPKDADKTDFYQHDQNWSNRLILGDSLQVMASLAVREGLRGKVQCIYLDPPYGIKFNSNFQWSTTSRDVTDGNAGHITREPEQVKAFRDTWRDGVHSYLTYLRDRFTVARDLLAESGSIFVQIGDENVHRVRAVLDEVFGDKNFVVTIPFVKKGNQKGESIESINDYILWFAKRRTSLKTRNLYKKSADTEQLDRDFKRVTYDGRDLSITEFSDLIGSSSPLTARDILERYPAAKLYMSDNLTVGGTRANQSVLFRFRGKDSDPGLAKNRCWMHTARPREAENYCGLDRLAFADRLIESNGNGPIRRKVFLSDSGVTKWSNWWDDTGIAGFAADKVYVVQTNAKVIERCILMASDPGDLVLDPTCGSGTAAYVAEQWGRRWITIDTSRVALALARARIMGARYPYYLLADSQEGQAKEALLTRSIARAHHTHNDIRHGFVYERSPKITSSVVANSADVDVIWETWQAVMDPLRKSLNALLKKQWEEWEIPRDADVEWRDSAREVHKKWWSARLARQQEIDASIAATAEVEYLYDKPYADKKKVRVAGPFTVESLSPHRVLGVGAEDELVDASQLRDAGHLEYGDKRSFPDMILDNLKIAGVQQAHKADRIAFTSVTRWPGSFVCAEGKYMESNIERRAGIFIGPEFGTVQRVDLVAAAREAGDAGFDVLVACAFNYEAHTTEFAKLGRLPVLKARMNADLHMAGELRSTDKGNLFVVFGEPDVTLFPEKDGRLRVKINGVDVFKPQTGEVVSDNADGIACWFIDTDYNEESFFVRHAYFLGTNNPYESLRTTLKAEIDDQAWGSLHSDTSRPFDKPARGRIAVKVINHLGDEVMKVFRV